MATPVSSIRNLGPAFESDCRRAGITTAEELRALGPDLAYGRVIRSGTTPHFIGYYSLVMGLQGRPWNDCRGDEKRALRARFDAIKAEARPAQISGLDKALDEIGVIARPRG